MRSMQLLCHAAFFWLVLVTGPIGCDKPAPTPAGEATNRIGVLVAAYPEAAIARAVGGDAVRVDWLVEDGHHPAEIQDSPELRQRLGDARVIITSGPGDVWAWHDLSPEARAQRLIEPDRMPSARGDGGASPGLVGRAGAAEMTAYAWLDPRVMADVVDALGFKLATIDPKRHDRFIGAAATVRGDLLALDAEIAAALAPMRGRAVLVVRPVYAVFLRRYGLVQVAPLAGDATDPHQLPQEARLTDRQFNALVAAARASGLKVIYVDSATPAAVRQHIAERTGLTVRLLDATGTSAPAGRSTYAAVLRYNVEQLKDGE